MSSPGAALDFPFHEDRMYYCYGRHTQVLIFKAQQLLKCLTGFTATISIVAALGAKPISHLHVPASPENLTVAVDFICIARGIKSSSTPDQSLPSDPCSLCPTFLFLLPFSGSNSLYYYVHLFSNVNYAQIYIPFWKRTNLSVLLPRAPPNFV